MRLWDKKREREHERDMLKLNLEADKARASLEMQKIELQGQVQQNVEELRAMVSALQAQQKPVQLTGNKFLDFLLVIADAASSFVRPVLTYWYCVVAYGAYKTALYVKFYSGVGDWKESVLAIWTKEDHAVMMSIIGFWFVDRALRVGAAIKSRP